MTIQPSAPPECPAEQRQPLDPDSRPLPDGWCYACWEATHQRRGHHRAQPDTLTATAERIAARALLDAEMPFRLADWQVGQIALVRAVATELYMIATSTEAHLARH